MFRFYFLALVLILFCLTIADAQENVPDPNTTFQASDSSDVLINVYIDNAHGFPPYGRLGIGLGADAVYRKKSGFSWNGYIDTVYENFSEHTNIYTPSNLDDQFGLARAVGYFGYRISDRLVINSEIGWSRDLEDNRTGKVSMDLAYMDYFLKKDLTLRAGMLLLPMGLVNEFHRPDEVLGTRRALGDIETIPSTWHAFGVGIAGHKSFLDYRFYVVSGLDASGFTINGTRKTREVNWDTLKTPAVVFRFDAHVFRGGMLGGSVYVGSNGIHDSPIPTDVKVRSVTQEVHFQFIGRGGVIRAQYVKTELNNSRNLNIAMGTKGFDGIGSRFVGGYVEGGYNLLHHRKNGTSLMPFFRIEETNPQDALPQSSVDLGLRKNLTVDHFVYTYGVEIRPIYSLIIKVDAQQNKVEKIDYGVNQFSIGLSYLF